MIVILNPPQVGNGRVGKLKDAWTGFSRKHGETVMECADTRLNERRILNGANRTHDRLVVTRPGFIPSPSFFEELDYLREQGIYVVLMKRKKHYFNPGETRPYKSIDDGIFNDVAVFQLGGQDKFLLPENIDFHWLATRRRMEIIRLNSMFLGSSERGGTHGSIIGEVVPGIDGRAQAVHMGCFNMGGDLHYPKSVQMRLWDGGVEAMSIWGRMA